MRLAGVRDHVRLRRRRSAVLADARRRICKIADGCSRDRHLLRSASPIVCAADLTPADRRSSSIRSADRARNVVTEPLPNPLGGTAGLWRDGKAISLIRRGVPGRRPQERQ